MKTKNEQAANISRKKEFVLKFLILEGTLLVYFIKYENGGPGWLGWSTRLDLKVVR